MAKPVCVRELDRPPGVRQGPDDLAVDEVADSPDPHEERAGNDQGVGQEQERLSVQDCEEACAGRSPE